MMEYIGHLEEEDSRNMNDKDFADMSVKSNFYFGIGIGSLLMGVLTAGVTFIVNAVVLNFGGRKEKMLIHYYDKSNSNDSKD